MDCNYTLPREKHVKVAKFIRNHYFGWEKIDDITIQSLIQVANDRFFVVDSEKPAKCRLKLINNLFDITIISTEVHSVSDAMSRTTNDYGILFRSYLDYII